MHLSWIRIEICSGQMTSLSIQAKQIFVRSNQGRQTMAHALIKHNALQINVHFKKRFHVPKYRLNPCQMISFVNWI